MKVLVVGSGGREHALAWKLKASPRVTRVFVAPGNAGTALDAENVPIAADDLAGLLRFAKQNAIELTVVGPEAPLVAGIVDVFQREKLRIFGPSKAAAQLEGSKVFCKTLLHAADVPTAEFRVFRDADSATRYVLDRYPSDEGSVPLVVKADGLAAGKGVVVCSTRREVLAAIDRIARQKVFGAAGRQIVIEERLHGQEASVLAITDGRTIVTLPPAQDHKPAFDGDTGPNTGGMGAYCDTRILKPRQTSAILDRVVYPVLHGLRREGVPFTGFLYAGLMMVDGEPKVLEFNVRLGDPEAQALLHRMDEDLLPLLEAAARGSLTESALRWRQGPSVCVVLAAEGYPGTPRKGDPIRGIEEAESLGAAVFHAGTRMTDQGLVTAGGRVLGVTCRGEDLRSAIDNCYAAVSRIHFAGMHYRKDIGRKGLKRWSALE